MPDSAVLPPLRLQGRSVAATRLPVDSVMIFLHGLGADASDLFGVAQNFAEKLPSTYMFVPNAPFPCAMNPQGFQWFDFADRSETALYKEVKKAASYLNEAIDYFIKYYKIAPSRIVLFGFSQGAMTALHVALRRDRKLGAVLAYSGALLGDESTSYEYISKTPVCLVHGRADQVVPFSAFEEAKHRLQAAGVPVRGFANQTLGHGIDQGGMQIGLRMATEALAPKSPDHPL
ncbi:MAG: dienelactone hydrolase family protein [Rickettsiales bacterium]